LSRDYKILRGNCVNVLQTLPDNSIDCCVTSPPYYALRDYGTGHWEGGDANCDHVANEKATKHFGNELFNENRPSRDETICKGYYKAICPKCGAVRVDEQIGLEETPEQYIQKLVDVFHEVKRALKDNGTLWINIADSYWGSGSRGFDFTDTFSEASKIQQGSKGTTDLHNIPKLQGTFDSYKNKDLIGIPWMLAFALRADGWYLRQDIIWAKTNCMPESVRDRCTKSHEYIFLLSKQPHYYYDADAIKTPCTTTTTRANYGWDCDTPSAGQSGIHTQKMGNRFAPESGANKRDVWIVNNSGGYKDKNGAHYATYPQDLIEPCILAGSKAGGCVLDPFSGSGTTGIVATKNQRNYIGIELNEHYADMSEERLKEANAQTTIFDFV